jgi:MSHA biogenesis protein MshL
MKRDRTPPFLRLTASSLAALALLGLLGLLGGCANWLPRSAPAPAAPPRGDVTATAPRVATPVPAGPIAAAPTAAAPAAAARPEASAEPRFDLIVNGAQARDVFLALVADTRYSMLMHPAVAGPLSVTLRAVTVREALDSIRDVYGFDYKIDGRRITVYPPTMQTRIFTLNYLNTSRQGRSDLRVSSGSARANAANNNPSNGNAPLTAPTPSGAPAPDSSQVSSSSNADIWTETGEALRGIVGAGGGRNVIMSPQSGTIAVRAMPDELRQVEAFLRASRLALERQVMLEAKIVQVELRDGFQSGIDWSVLRGRGSVGQTSGYPNNPLIANGNGLPTLPAAVGSLMVDSVSLPTAASGTLGLSLATNGFSAVLGFLETHGEVQILSSPRVATLNNQKAVLKVGTDEYFVTNVSGGTITNGTNSTNGTTTLPTLTLTPFFSGIALDVTPQIDDAETITLHVRPSVTTVTEKTKQIDLGTIGNYRLPLASSAVNETDTVVRVTDGHIVAIGGLMQTDSGRSSSGVPGTQGNVFTRTLFGNTASAARKSELVVLIKPTIIRTAEDWQRTTDQALAGIEASGLEPRRVITVDARPASGSAASGR